MYRNMLIASLSLLIFAATSLADVPMYFNYQGNLTDDAGEPITNITPGVQMTFTIWFVEFEMDPGYIMWSSGPVPVPVENGLFEYQIGPFDQATLLYFRDSPNYWLGIQVEGDPELSPRTRLISVPYACHAATADNAASADHATTTEDIYVDEAGDEMTGNLTFDLNDDDLNDAVIFLSDNSGNLRLYDNGMPTAFLYGDTWGELVIYSPVGEWMSRVHLAGRQDQSYLMLSAENSNIKAQLSAFNTGGALAIKNSSDLDAIVMDGGENGDDAVVLPENAINNTEILDEPGLISNVDVATRTLNTSAMTDIIFVNMTTPADGYIMLMGRTTVHLWGTTSGNWAVFQIDQSSGGSANPGYFTEVGTDAFPSVSTFGYSVYVDRIYYMPAGDYQFRLEGMNFSSDPYANASAVNSSLTAVFYPTSYGSVKGIASDPGDHPGAGTVSAFDPASKTERTAYEIDLRYYEIRDREAKMRALKAELELRQAQQAAGLLPERRGDIE